MWTSFMAWNLAAPVFSILWLILFAALIIWLWRRPKSVGRVIGLVIGVLGFALGVLMLVGSLAYQSGSRSEMASVERPGKLIDIGGYGIHVACAGTSRPGQPTVIWISGGHSPGLMFNHLHTAWQANGRSCFLDRAGTGWSDPGPAPRSVKMIATEFDKAIKGAGETGPFVVVGHSLGGLVGVNWAARNREDIVGVVALDPTSQEMIQTGGIREPGGWCRAPDPGLSMTMSAFGIGHLIPALHPMNSENYRTLNAEIADVLPAIKAMESRPRALLEGSKHYGVMCFSGYETIRHPGALGDLPVLAIVQRPDKFDAEARAAAEQWSGVSDDLEWEIYKASALAASKEYPAFSSRGERVLLPDDWGHNFPMTQPDYVLEQVSDFIERLNTPEVDVSETLPDVSPADESGE